MIYILIYYVILHRDLSILGFLASVGDQSPAIPDAIECPYKNVLVLSLASKLKQIREAK